MLKTHWLCPRLPRQVGGEGDKELQGEDYKD